MNKKIIISVASLLLFVSVLHAQTENNLNAFKNIKNIGSISISVPTVVEVPFVAGEVENLKMVVLDVESGKFVPSLLKTYSRTEKTPMTVSSNASTPSISMLDSNYSSYASFLAVEDTSKTAVITMKSIKAITSSKMSVVLDRNVALPRTVKIIADGNIIVSKKSMNTTNINFPKTTAKSWEMTFEYIQPLRISELQIISDVNKNSKNYGLRFLAKPGREYKIYTNPDRLVRVSTGEAPNLNSNQDVLFLDSVLSNNNATYVKADVDGDSIPDILDNCVSIANTDQVDVNSNGRGDACDDFDKDGVINSKDNCINDVNRYQEDVDGDGIGNVCDNEESRLTERLPWLPWVGMGTVAIVLFGMFGFVAIRFKKEKDLELKNKEQDSTE